MSSKNRIEKADDYISKASEKLKEASRVADRDEERSDAVLAASHAATGLGYAFLALLQIQLHKVEKQSGD